MRSDIFVFLLVFLFVCVFAGGAFAADHDGFGIGTAFYGGYGYGPGLLLKIPPLPLYWGINVSVGGIRGVQDDPYFGVSISSDYHFLERAFPGNEKFGWFLGGGLIFSHSHFDGKSALAGRLPAGITFSPIRTLDFVFELAPSAGFCAWSSAVEFDYGMSGSLGIRYWF